jgi:hypothetical protein
LRKVIFGAVALALVLGAPQLAFAKKPPTFTPCTLGDITAAAQACVGWDDGNLDGGSPADNIATAADLNKLLNVSTFTATNFTVLKDLTTFDGNAAKNTVDFGRGLYGETVVSFHVGGAGKSGVGYESTAFYEFNAGNIVGGLQSFVFNIQGLSNARLYSTGAYQTCTSNCGGGGGAVPEPAAWALMLAGLSGIGAVARTRRRNLAVAG